MTKLLYWRLALNNLRKNCRTFLPFLFASTLLTFSLYSFMMILYNPGFSLVHGGDSFLIILQFGLVVVVLFTAIFLFYANSFLIKRRKKELGLYAILGMEKKHIARVLRHELTLTYLLSMLLGLGLGVLLSRLLFLLIRLAIRMDVPITAAFSLPATVGTLIVFAVLFVLLMAYNSFQVRSVSPVQLLRGGETGEREPKARWILAVLGVACMGAGYWMAQTVQNPMSAIALFFVAVVLVILGTYLLFLAGSIALLKLLKGRKSFYYKPSHFVTVSGMLYRMKQNAAGLASIAILCTMAMLTIGTTVAMYCGSEKMLDEYYPSDVLISYATQDELTTGLARVDEASALSGVPVTDCRTFTMVQSACALESGVLSPFDESRSDGFTYYNNALDVMVFSADNYAKLEGLTLTPDAGEVGWYFEKPLTGGELVIGEQTYRAQTLSELDFPIVPASPFGSAFATAYLVAPNDEAAHEIAAVLCAGEPVDRMIVQWNLDGTQAEKLAYANAFRELYHGEPRNFRDKAGLRQEWYAMHGGFLFVGIFLGVIFLMGTAMILYFKQISEGYQDHDRFIILQKVGMSPEEVKSTVRKQILIVFFLPLAVAVCHIAGSLHMMVLCLRLFGLMDVPYIALNTFAAALGVGVFYGLFYLRTNRAYYRLVRMG